MTLAPPARLAPRRIALTPALLPIALGLGGCTGVGPGKDGTADPLRVETQSVVSDSNGEVHIDVDVQEGEHFQVIQDDPAGGVVFTDSLTDPDGNKVLDWADWQSSAYSYTEAVYGANYANTLNWPVREEDGPVAAGTWTFVGDTLTARYTQKADVPIDVTVAYLKDDDPTKGDLHVVVAYCTGLRDDAEIVRGIEAGVAYWTEIYAAFGVTLTVEYADIDLDPALPDTYEGEQAYEDLMAQYTGYPLLLVVGDTIAGDLYTYGEAAAIPGPITATPITAVELSWMSHAGGNGTFSDGEIGIMGETMAHETGHYLGLFHPVEDGWTYWDDLDDTADCTDASTCEDELGTNLMFPYPVCLTFTACDPQDQLSPKQVGMMQYYVGVQ